MKWWNYRVLRKRHADGSATYHVHEVYYGDDGEIKGWIEEPDAPVSQEVAGLREVINMMRQAFRRPILEIRGTDEDQDLVPDETDDTINAGHYFEFMDRASVAGDYLDQFLGNHPVLRKEEEEGTLRAAYERAEEALAELYQRASGMAFEKETVSGSSQRGENKDAK